MLKGRWHCYLRMMQHTVCWQRIFRLDRLRLEMRRGDASAIPGAALRRGAQARGKGTLESQRQVCAFPLTLTTRDASYSWHDTLSAWRRAALQLPPRCSSPGVTWFFSDILHHLRTLLKRMRCCLSFTNLEWECEPGVDEAWMSRDEFSWLNWLNIYCVWEVCIVYQCMWWGSNNMQICWGYVDLSHTAVEEVTLYLTVNQRQYGWGEMLVYSGHKGYS